MEPTAQKEVPGVKPVATKFKKPAKSNILLTREFKPVLVEVTTEIIRSQLQAEGTPAATISGDEGGMTVSIDPPVSSEAAAAAAFKELRIQPPVQSPAPVGLLDLDSYKKLKETRGIEPVVEFYSRVVEEQAPLVADSTTSRKLIEQRKLEQDLWGRNRCQQERIHAKLRKIKEDNNETEDGDDDYRDKLWRDVEKERRAASRRSVG